MRLPSSPPLSYSVPGCAVGSRRPGRSGAHRRQVLVWVAGLVCDGHAGVCVPCRRSAAFPPLEGSHILIKTPSHQTPNPTLRSAGTEPVAGKETPPRTARKPPALRPSSRRLGRNKVTIYVVKVLVEHRDSPDTLRDLHTLPPQPAVGTVLIRFAVQWGIVRPDPASRSGRPCPAAFRPPGTGCGELCRRFPQLNGAGGQLQRGKEENG